MKANLVAQEIATPPDEVGIEIAMTIPHNNSPGIHISNSNLTMYIFNVYFKQIHTQTIPA